MLLSNCKLNSDGSPLWLRVCVLEGGSVPFCPQNSTGR